MTTGDVRQLVAKFAVPSIITMLVSGFYNMADAFFVGKIDTQSTAALGIVFSYMALIQAIAFFFGQGSGNYISRALGRKDMAEAETMASVGLLSALLASVAIAVVGFVWMRPVLLFFGSTEAVLPCAMSYFRWILFGTPFIVGCFSLNNQMRQQGNALLAMIGIAIGAVLNIVIDPLFIFTFDMGVSGAGMATFFSQAVSFFILLYMAGKRGGIAIRLSCFKPSWERYKEIAAGGFPSLARQGVGAITAVCLNRVANDYGTEALAAFTIVNRYMLFVGAAMIGYGQGFQPVCGFNYGAERYRRVKAAFWHSARLSSIYGTVIAVASVVFAPEVIRFFRADDAEVIRMGTMILRCQCVAYPFVGFIIITNMYLQNIRETWPAIFVASARQGLFLIPTLYAGTAMFGFYGLVFAQGLSDFLSFLVALPIALRTLRQMK